MKIVECHCDTSRDHHWIGCPMHPRYSAPTPRHYPVVNLNGSPRERLIEERSAAGDALNAAIQAVALIEPNPRDYQTVGQEPFMLARQLHAQRLASLLVIRDELMKEIEFLADGR